MTPEAIKRTAENLMQVIGISGWGIELVPFFPEHPYRTGQCDYVRRVISFATTSLGDDAEDLDCIEHEIAHIVSEGGHGPRFRSAMRFVKEHRGLRREIVLGPQAEPIEFLTLAPVTPPGNNGPAER